MLLMLLMLSGHHPQKNKVCIPTISILLLLVGNPVRQTFRNAFWGLSTLDASYVPEGQQPDGFSWAIQAS